MLRIEMVTIDCRDPRTLAEWWARQLGGRVLEGFEGDDYVLVATEHGPRLGFQRVAEPTPGKNRVHLDVTTPDRDHEVERLLAEGALEVARHEVGGFTWVVLSDPEGNQFCVSQAH
jgi:predicted enzyme related to lactoylglutathione lyase